MVIVMAFLAAVFIIFSISITPLSMLSELILNLAPILKRYLFMIDWYIPQFILLMLYFDR